MLSGSRAASQYLIGGEGEIELEATPMKQNRVVSIAVLFLLFGATIPAFADKDKGGKGGGGGKGQQAQHQQQSQRGQHAQQAQRSQYTQQPQQRGGQQGQRAAYNRGNGNNGFHGNGNNGNHYGRIADDRYRANFGHGHWFRMGRPRFVSGYNRFQYSGYWFGYNEPWPSGWGYNDDVYVEYIEGGYYMYNRRHPGIHLTLNLF
jgi:hypothetical protein